MSIVLTQDMPGATREWVEQVTAELHFDRNGTPKGLIVHAACEIPGGVRIVDIWESEADYESFGENQLKGAVEKVAADNGVDLNQAPSSQPSLAEAFDVVQPKT
jgi:hypothetical protein